MVFAEVMQRAFAGDGLNAAHARRNAGLVQQLNQADLAGGRGVRASAKFGGEVTDLDNADAVPIFFAEECHGFVLIDGDIDGNVGNSLNFGVAEDLFIDDVFDVLELFIGDGGEVRKI